MRRARVSLTIATGSSLWPSRSLKSRPAMIGTPSAAKYPGEIRRKCGAGPITFPLLTESGKSTLISVTKGGSRSEPTDQVQVTLDLLILKILALEPLHRRLARGATQGGLRYAS